MRTFITTSLLSSALLFMTSLVGIPASAQVSVGIRIFAPPEPRVVAVVPAQPGPDFVWIDGYWYPVASHYRWHEGYWSRPPYEGARWVGPRHDGDRFYNGYWDGDHGRVEHDHKWDHYHERDHGRYHDHGDHDHGHGHDHDDHH
jgi:WXXGXW repeat (2 copies)